ncbi:MAG: MFS transporter [Clostridium sp.]|uniref:MFS transporter n=1 Tax=Clostridium sp. TaxID=1506 RepID=UPI003F39B962
MGNNLCKKKTEKVSYKSTIYACYIGYFIQAIVVNLTPLLFIPLMEEFNLSYGQIGILIVVNFVTQFIFDIAFSKPVDKYGFRPFAIVAHIFCVVGFVLFSMTPVIFKGNEMVGFLIATMIFSGAGGLLEIILSPIIDAIPSEDSASAMSLLHSFYAWGQVAVILITTIFLFIFGKGSWSTIVLIWAIVPFVNIFIFMKVPLTRKVEASKIIKIKELIKNPVFIIAFFAIMMGN